ncbi:MAG TPA: glycosyltransferase family 4 protein [Lacipirellulaceae bacterium]|jgi:glycosyltransferase involved in cell wall biosynthesis
MKVAVLSHAFEEYCIQLANGLARESEVLLLLSRPEAAEYADQLDPAIHYRPFEKLRLRQPARQLAAAAGLVRQIRRFQPDVIHFQHGHLWFNFLLPWLRSYPLVVTIHDPRQHVGDAHSRKTPQSILEYGYRRASRVIVHGEALKRQVVESLGFKSDKVHVVPHIAIGQGNECQSDAHKDSNTVLFFGRIWDYKGLEFLIRAEPMINQAIPNARIVIAGEGDDFEPYRRMMARPDRFVVHNRYISAAERDQLFREASVVVLPYVDATQSGVIPVAYSYGLAVVATRVGALAEAVDEGQTGLLVPPRDPEALAAAVIELLADPERSRAMGAAGRKKLDAEYSPQVVAQQTVDVYRRAIYDRAKVRRGISAGGRVAMSLEQSRP